MIRERGIVVIPTYDEAQNIELIVDRVRACVPELDVLVVDDSSPDGTGELAEKVARHDPHVRVLHREKKSGLGDAYLAGFTWALQRDYELIIAMDADGSHLPEQLPRLLEAITDADLVIGARWVPGGRVVNWPKRRELLSRGANAYANVALGIGVHDATAGFRVFRRTTLDSIDLTRVRSHGYCFQIDVTRRVAAAGLRIVEVPITFVERVHGESKMTGSIVREALVRVTQWGLQYRTRQLRGVATPAHERSRRP